MRTDERDTRPVAVGVDGCSHTSAALQHGVREAHGRGAELLLVHVVPVCAPAVPFPAGSWDDLEEVGQAVLRSAAAQARSVDPTVEVTTTLRHGARVAGLVASSEQCQLLVVGSESQQGLDRLVLGTTTAGAAARARCPVQVVPERYAGGAGAVVVGATSPEHLTRLLPRAVEAAATRGGRVLVVHAWQMPDPYVDRVEGRTHPDAWRGAATKAFGPVLSRAREGHPGLDIELRVEHVDPAAALVAAAADAGLVLLERPLHPAWLPGHLGRTARHLLRRSAAVVEVDPVGSPVGRPATPEAR